MNVILLTQHAVACTLTHTRLTPPLNPPVNCAGERSSIPGLVHTVPAEGELTGRRQRTARNNRYDPQTEDLQSTQPLNLNPRRVHIEVTPRCLAREFRRTHKGEAHRVSNDTIAQEGRGLGAQSTLGRATPGKGQFNRTRMGAVAQGAQNGRLAFFPRESPDGEDTNNRRVTFIATRIRVIDPLPQRDTIRQKQERGAQRKRLQTIPDGLRRALHERTPIEDGTLPQLKDHAIEQARPIQVDRGRQILGVNVIGRQSGHTRPAGKLRNDSLQIERLFEMNNVGPLERSLHLGAPHARKGVPLGGYEGSHNGNRHGRERILRHADTTIIPIERRSRENAHVMSTLPKQRNCPPRRSRQAVATGIEIVDHEQNIQGPFTSPSPSDHNTILSRPFGQHASVADVPTHTSHVNR